MVDICYSRHQAELEQQARKHQEEIGRATAELIESQEALRQRRTDTEAAKELLWTQHRRLQRLAQSRSEVRQELAATQNELERLRQEHTKLLGSRSWRVIEALQSQAMRHPRAARSAIGVARFAWHASRLALLAARLRWGQIADEWRVRRTLQQEEAILAADPMFDAQYYQRNHMPTNARGWSPVRHYILRGRYNFLSPHPLFDMRWYWKTYSPTTGGDPLLHYIRFGRAAGNKPNPFFDPAWYLRRYPDVAVAGIDPVLHYMLRGASEGRDASGDFKTKWYLDNNKDVSCSGLNPLQHYLLHGRGEGRIANAYAADFSDAKPITATAIECWKAPALRREVALFVTHSPNGRLKPHVRHYLESLAREGIGITLIVAADQGFVEDEPSLYDLVDGLYIRANEGWDFACWAHVMRLNRQLYGADIVYLLNDSLIGPVTQDAFHQLLIRIRGNPAALVGLTANHERWRHLQSYFLAVKREALESWVFQEFMLGVMCLGEKEDVINAYEIRLSPRIEAGGLRTAALFEPDTRQNPTLHNWRELLDQGFPFIKIVLLTGEIPGVEARDWREVLQRHGYDVLLADRLLAEIEDPAPFPAVLRAKRQLRVRQPPKVTFVGPWNYANGLGVASRGYVAAWMHTGLPVNILPIEREFHVHARVTPTLGSAEFIDMPDVAIVHINADASSLLTSEQQAIIGRARWHIAAYVWESQILPEYYQEQMRGLDAVWAASSYCAASFRQHARCPVHVVPYAVPVPQLTADFARSLRVKRSLGLREDRRIILYSFDATSYLARKNPLALLIAFRRSELAADGWQLVLKTKHLSHSSVDSRALVKAVEQTSGVTLVDRTMGIGMAHALMDAADIYASPHASEGFGLTVAEAMARGKVVVASDFGGTTDILDQACGFPVPCHPWQLEHDEGPYPRGTIWGKVDEDELARALLKSATMDASERNEIGARARQQIASRLSPATVARRIVASIKQVTTA